MQTAAEILRTKGQEVWSVEPGETILHAIKLMANHEVGALLVMENDKLIGIVSERDYARKVILKGLSSKDVKISEVMTRDVVSVSQDHTVKECMVLMNEKEIRHLPVLDDGELVGMVSVRDMVDCIIEEQVATIGNLQSYTRSFLLIGLAIVMTVVVLLIAS